MIETISKRLRGAPRDERGMTLVELMISVALMVVVATIFTTVLLSIQKAVIRQQARSEMNDQARLALQQMDREIRSGNFIYDPADELLGTCAGKQCAPSYSLRVFTQVNAPTRIPPEQCVQWVIDDQQLFRRAWAPGEATSLNGWRMVADGIVNRDLGTPIPAFSVDASGKVLDISLMLNSKLESSDAPRTIQMNTSIAIRNPATAGPCDPVPAS
jgi:prepilin-type N-terminal cleavage/methylation domain-containing protein